ICRAAQARFVRRTRLVTLAERARASWPRAARVGLYVAGVTFLRAAFALLSVNGRPIFLIVSPALAFVIFTSAMYLLLISGAVKHDHLEFIVSPWFAWGAIGAFVSFIVVLISYGHSEFHPHILEYATLGAAGWVVSVTLVWLTGRAVRGGA